MTKETKKWMPMFWPEYLADTGHLNTTEHGAYMLLIAHYWMTGGLPQDERIIARITRMTPRQWSRSRDLLRSLFDDHWRHTRVDQELAYAVEKSKRMSANAKLRHSNGRAEAYTPTPTPTPTEERKEERESARAKSGQPRQRKRALRTAMPDNWQPTEAGYLYAKDHGFQQPRLGQLIEACRDYHISKGTQIAGQNGLAATWRTWVNKQISFDEHDKQRSNGSGRNRETFEERVSNLVKRSRDVERAVAAGRAFDNIGGDSSGGQDDCGVCQSGKGQ